MAVSHPTCAIEAGHGWAVGWVIAGYAAGISVSGVQVKHLTAPEAMRRRLLGFGGSGCEA